jgi:methylmalonyl-CoA/ethylmalonyl-CoA epimerase
LAKLKNEKIAHLGYVVSNIEDSLKLWVSTGYRVSIEKTYDPLQNVYCLLLTKPGEPNIELVAPHEGGSNPLVSRLKRGGGLDHICFYSLDLEKSLDEEVTNNSIVICKPTFATMFNCKIAFVYRRCGLIIEYLEMQTNDFP